MLPVYRPGLSLTTVADRRSALKGWVFSVISFHDMMFGVRGDTMGDIHFEVYDGPEVRPKNVLFNHAYGMHDSSLVRDKQEIRIEVGGRQWTLVFGKLPAFYTFVNGKQPVVTLIVGTIGSLLLFGFLWSIGRAQREIEQLNRRNELLLNCTAEGIYGLDLEGRTTFINPAAATMIGWEAKDLIRKPLHVILHHTRPDGSPYPQEECPIYAAFTDGIVHHVDNEVFWHKNGASFPVEYVSTPIREDGKLVGAAVNFREITARRELEAQLQQAQKLESIGQLAAGIAHEINTPTQFVGDNTRFLQEAFGDLTTFTEKSSELIKAADVGPIPRALIEDAKTTMAQADLDYLNEEIPSAIGQSLEGIERVAKIVRAMKDFAHPGVEKKPVDLNRAIETTITVARSEWKHVAEMVTDLDPALPPVPCLANEFNQVILNMIINAAHAIADARGEDTEHRGTITVTTRYVDDWAEIRIADTGTGIPEHIRSRVFDHFFTTKEVGKGTGQGLGIAHGVVIKKHGGEINLESEVGKGTTFIVRLPLTALDQLSEEVAA